MAPRIVSCDSLPSIDRLCALFILTAGGNLIRRISAAPRWPAGAVAGNADPSGYRKVRVDGTLLWEHRVVFAIAYGRWPAADTIDHVNGVRSDNRPENLREATYAQNNQNTPVRRTNETKLKGVSPNGFGKFRARIRDRHIGTFSSAHEAKAAYDAAAALEYGEFLCR